MDFKLTINGKSYPARHTLRTSILAAERRGGLEQMLRNKNQAEFLEDLAWLAAEQMKAAAKYQAILNGSDTMQETPSAELILDTMDYADILALQKEMLDVINKEEPTVQAEAQGKNAEATSDD